MQPSRITVEETISMGHRLPTYDGICSSPHGHNVTVEVVVESPKFLDFKRVSSVLKNVLSEFDHAMVLWSSDELARVLLRYNSNFRVVQLNQEPTTEVLAQHFFNELAKQIEMMGPYQVISVTVHETARYAATATSPDPLVERTA